MDNADNTAWVFDSLVGFLHGPVWNIPLQSFIEEKSLIFEPTENGEVQDLPEYESIHEEYKNLVDVMLSSFMDDIGITAEQFEAACRMSARNIAGLPAQFHRRLFEQIWAANDFEIFVKLMTQKNVELQLQALELIERRFGALSSMCSGTSADLDSTRSDDDADWSDSDDIMTELKKMTLEVPPSEPEDDVPVEVVAEKQNLLTKLQNFGKSDVLKTIPENKEASKVIEPKPLPKKVVVSEEEVQARQDYLKQQRDKLLALKKQVRERKLGSAMENGDGDNTGSSSSRATTRPRSARAAAAALAGQTPKSSPDALQLRRALATKLKTEVVNSEK